ncbi:MAG TPA: heparinase II/III family protein [Candidatus Hydrogenedentes bacterium]|nr:heparinase II/III family protein [Candidatus Hydrogenedentota bacterium]HOL76145.1 heparinase II/III family protein [Candidatus Hydrogenedentota bacterium]HPO84759.1 heparinase II/III family protein [Candidatus Hydrogenedentota bacterium]
MNIVSIAGLVIGVLNSTTSAGIAEHKGCVPLPFSEVRTILDTPCPESLFPELKDFDKKSALELSFSQKLVDEIALPAETIPLTTYTLYREFRAKGTREGYQKPYYDKRRQMRSAALAYWLLGQTERLDELNDLIWNICEETTWVVPAHEREPEFIDLFSAETASDLAHVVYLLKENLPKEICQRVYREILNRIIDPYVEYGRSYWWDSGRNNWTGVCAGSIGECALLLDLDTEKTAAVVTIVLEQLDRFLEKGFEKDGGCLEGVGYWNYGLLHLVTFGELLRVRTNGKIDILADPRLKPIAQYPLVVSIGKGRYASFSDSHEKQTLRPFLIARLSARTDTPQLKMLYAESNDWRFSVCFRDLLWARDIPNSKPVLENAFLPISGLVKLISHDNEGRPVVLAAKAGHNAEPHNHNDIGSFIFAVGETVYLCDPGAGRYTRDYFGPRRYENIFASSYGHSVPRIAGKEQSPGSEFRGTMTKIADDTYQIDMTKTYNLPIMKSFLRTLTLQKDGEMILEDRFCFDNGDAEIEEAFVTWLEVEAVGNHARIKSAEGYVEIACESASQHFRVETLDEACRANKKEEDLKRITLTIPPQSENTVRFRMRFVPKLGKQ